MRSEVHAELQRQLDLPVGACPNAKQLLQAYQENGITAEGLISMCGTIAQQKAISRNHVLKQRVRSLADRYLEGVDVLQLSVEADFPPCLLMRRLLEHLLPTLGGAAPTKQAMSEVMRNPSKLAALLPSASAPAPDAIAAPEPAAGQAQHGACPPCSSASPPHAMASRQQERGAGGAAGAVAGGGRRRRLAQRLQRDMLRCSLADASYSPWADAARQATGLEHEQLLVRQLREVGVGCFWTEAQLRQQGCFKTPDVRLQVPMAVRRTRLCGVKDRCSGAGAAAAWTAGAGCKGQAHGKDEAAATEGPEAPDTWHVVTWIDSKATFGDVTSHARQLEEQYSTYVNRFGPGLVIHWAGFVDELNLGVSTGVLLVDHLPGPGEFVLMHSLGA